VREQGLARRRETNAAAGTMEQPGADVAFEAGDRLAQRRLAAADTVGGTMQLAKLGGRDEIPKIAHVHSDDFPLSTKNQKRFEFMPGLVNMSRWTMSLRALA
jgi:hypothetical protein